MDRSALQRELARLLERHRERPEGRAFAPLADCHRKLGQFDQALELLREGLQRHPDYNAARVILGKLHQDTEQLEDAKVAYSTALELDPYNLVARRQIAGLCEQLGDPAAAREHWQQLLLNDPAADDAEQALARLAVVPEETTPEPEEPPRRDVAVLQASLEPDDEEAAEVEPSAAAPSEGDRAGGSGESQPAPPPVAVSTPEGIVTVTLARIYRAQGFAARALEIYEELRRVSPHPEFEQAISELRDELGRRRPEPVREIEDFAPGRPIEIPVPSDGGPRFDEREMLQPLPTPAAADPLPSVEDFDHFRSWLNRIKVRD